MTNTRHIEAHRTRATSLQTSLTATFSYRDRHRGARRQTRTTCCAKLIVTNISKLTCETIGWFT